MATTDVSEREARQVAEAAREQEWKLPSFGKELFLGNFRLDLIHPQPRLDAEATEKGERFLATLREFLENEVDPLQIERDAKIPDEVIEGFKRIGAMGMKVAEEYDGLGLSQVYYNRALTMIGTWHGALGALVSAHQSIGVAEPLRMFGTEEQKREWLPRVARTDISAFLLTEPDVGSDPARVATSADPVEGGYVLNGTKLWATNGAIADVVVVMARVPKSEGHKGGISAFVLDYKTEGVTVKHRNAFMGLRGIENSVTLLKNVFVPTEQPDRQGGLGPQDRPLDAEHRPPGAAGDLRRPLQVGDQGRARVVDRARPVGPPGRQARRRRAEERVHRGAPRSAWRRCSTSPRGWPTRSATTSASRPRSPSSTAPSWAGRCWTSSSRSAAAAATRPPSR